MIQITIHFVPKIKRGRWEYWGFCEQEGDTFKVRVDDTAPLLEKVGILYHELTHALIGWAGKGVPSRKAEEEACNEVEEFGKRAVAMLWRKAKKKRKGRRRHGEPIL